MNRFKPSMEKVLLLLWIGLILFAFLIWTVAIFIDSPAEGNLAGFGFFPFVIGLVLIPIWGGLYHRWFEDW
jgi:hypothetical protein